MPFNLQQPNQETLVDDKIQWDQVHCLHIVGAGGVGMSALALLAKNLGFSVTASDLNESEYLNKLKEAGIPVWVGSHPERISKNAILFKSTAVPLTDPEVQYAKQQGIPVYSRHPLLSMITKKSFCLAVCGTHGKTTTTGWITYLLKTAGYDPTALVGGTLKDFRSNVVIGSGTFQNKPLFIVEADESDGSFLSIDADIVCVTNMEIDHPDHYKDQSEFLNTFYNFFQETITHKGKLFFSSEIEESIIKKFLNDENTNRPTIHSDTITYHGKSYKIGLLGHHNLFNASLVLQVANLLKIPDGVVRKTLLEFQGIKRRMDILFQNETVTVMDDYAHHPTEIATVFKTIKSQYEKIYVIWEPHRISRVLYFIEDYKKVFEEMKGRAKLYKMPIFTAGDNPADFPQWPSVEKELNTILHLDWNEKIEKEMLQFLPELKQKTLILFLGAGNSSKAAKDFVYKLSQKQKLNI
ncbi:MAG: hypothetical protein D6767_05455 [Candidatus Hydrogenedentota bacterium]|nr:MAG: hypothetical protein D6767_05455 [Candidatus Hydrogenedentota bacterium]